MFACFYRRAKFIHQEFRKTGFVSSIQHFVVEGKHPKMVNLTNQEPLYSDV